METSPLIPTALNLRNALRDARLYRTPRSLDEIKQAEESQAAEDAGNYDVTDKRRHISAGAITVLGVFASHGDPKDGFKSWPNVDTVAFGAKLDPTTVRKAIKELLAEGLIRRERRYMHSTETYINWQKVFEDAKKSKTVFKRKQAKKYGVTFVDPIDDANSGGSAFPHAHEQAERLATRMKNDFNVPGLSDAQQLEAVAAVFVVELLDEATEAELNTLLDSFNHGDGREFLGFMKRHPSPAGFLGENLPKKLRDFRRDNSACD